MAINRKKDDIIRESYFKLGDVAIQIVREARKGNSRTSRVKDLWSRGVKIRWLIKALEFEPRLTDIQINKFLDCLIKQSEIRSFGAGPKLALGNTKPTIVFTAGQPGGVGTPGAPGSDADIDMIDGSQIVVVETNPGGVKTFQTNLNLYSAPTILTEIDVQLMSGGQADKRVREEGENISTPLKATVTKGSANVTASTFLAPSALDATYQGILDIPTINSSGSQVITMADSGVTADQTYTIDVADGTNTPTNSDTLSFVFPFFYGSNTLVLSKTNASSQLTKTIEKQGDKTVLLNDTSAYFYFGFPEEYGVLTEIRDGNGFNVTSEFERVSDAGVLGSTEVFILDSSGVAIPWTHNYFMYRTKVVTDILSQNYQFKF